MALVMGVSVATVLYTLYIQFSSGMGGIFIRSDDKGNSVFCPGNVPRVMFAPLNIRAMWQPVMWDTNWFVWVFFGALVGITIESFF